MLKKNQKASKQAKQQAAALAQSGGTTPPSSGNPNILSVPAPATLAARSAPSPRSGLQRTLTPDNLVYDRLFRRNLPKKQIETLFERNVREAIDHTTKFHPHLEILLLKKPLDPHYTTCIDMLIYSSTQEGSMLPDFFPLDSNPIAAVHYILALFDILDVRMMSAEATKKALRTMKSTEPFTRAECLGKFFAVSSLPNTSRRLLLFFKRLIEQSSNSTEAMTLIVQHFGKNFFPSETAKRSRKDLMKFCIERVNYIFQDELSEDSFSRENQAYSEDFFSFALTADINLHRIIGTEIKTISSLINSSFPPLSPPSTSSSSPSSSSSSSVDSSNSKSHTPSPLVSSSSSESAARSQQKKSTPTTTAPPSATPSTSSSASTSATSSLSSSPSPIAAISSATKSDLINSRSNSSENFAEMSEERSRSQSLTRHNAVMDFRDNLEASSLSSQDGKASTDEKSGETEIEEEPLITQDPFFNEVAKSVADLGLLIKKSARRMDNFEKSIRSTMRSTSDLIEQIEPTYNNPTSNSDPASSPVSASPSVGRVRLATQEAITLVENFAQKYPQLKSNDLVLSPRTSEPSNTPAEQLSDPVPVPPSLPEPSLDPSPSSLS